MDSLKSAIADKVLEISSLNRDDMKAKLEKISRFRDFVFACQSLVVKYPSIETELLRMVENDDFDTKIASSRVDTIIRLSESGTPLSQIQQNNLEKDISELEEITEHLPDTEAENSEVLRTSIPVLERQEEEVPAYLPEDIDYEEVDSLTIETTGIGKEDQYIDFEEIAPIEEPKQNLLTEAETKKILELVDKTTDTPAPATYREPELVSKPSIKPQTGVVKETAKRGLQIVAVVAIVLALIFIIVFIINNTKLFLWGAGIAVVVVGIVWMQIKKKKGGGNE